MHPPASAVTRTPIHTRQIRVEGFQRSDGLWDIDGTLTDVKQVDHMLQTGLRRAGEPIHEMTLRLTLDHQMTIIAAHAVTQERPYPGQCESITPVYEQLKGLTIGAGFTRKVAALLGGTRGCTHLTELLGRMATGAFQTMAGRVPQAGDGVETRPFQLGGCHALALGGPVVAQYYPRWYVAPTRS
jgi:hypothetical protein